MGAAGAGEQQLESMIASIGSGLEGDKAAQILQKLASREADRRAQLKEQAASSRCLGSRLLFDATQASPTLSSIPC